MTVLKRAWRWLVDHWYVPLFVLGVLVGWFVSSRIRSNGDPVKQTLTELEVIQARTKARELQAELGAEKAREVIKEEYADEIDKLSLLQKAEATKLRDNPPALAAFLVRAGRS